MLNKFRDRVEVVCSTRTERIILIRVVFCNIAYDNRFPCGSRSRAHKIKLDGRNAPSLYENQGRRTTVSVLQGQKHFRYRFPPDALCFDTLNAARNDKAV